MPVTKTFVGIQDLLEKENKKNLFAETHKPFHGHLKNWCIFQSIAQTLRLKATKM